MKNKIYKLISRIYFKIVKISFEVRYSEFRKNYTLDDTFIFNGHNIVFYGGGEIEIGRNTYIGSYSTIQAYKNQKVTIGNNCSISHFVKIYTMNLNPDDIISNKSKVLKKHGDVTIGNNCWIGANVFIKENITIGDNCVVGANSVVTKNIPQNSIYAGNRIIRNK